MRAKSLVLILCAGSALYGCSSKPDVSDIRGELQEFWGTCPIVKLDNLKKTNGLDNGKTYRMAYTYTIEALEDYTEFENKCALRNILVLNQLTTDNTNKLKKGDVVNVNAEIDMVQSEKGWISQ